MYYYLRFFYPRVKNNLQIALLFDNWLLAGRHFVLLCMTCVKLTDVKCHVQKLYDFPKTKIEEIFVRTIRTLSLAYKNQT